MEISVPDGTSWYRSRYSNRGEILLYIIDDKITIRGRRAPNNYALTPENDQTSVRSGFLVAHMYRVFGCVFHVLYNLYQYDGLGGNFGSISKVSN
jgi:hypothetical protein